MCICLFMYEMYVMNVIIKSTFENVNLESDRFQAIHETVINDNKNQLINLNLIDLFGDGFQPLHQVSLHFVQFALDFRHKRVLPHGLLKRLMYVVQTCFRTRV